ncbi:hypothetical protein FB451DRAFT_1366737 [Mycena latifolia]|nr:hypothetical protein FB451DRAFT_1366737 [Mycena latifolia]
MPAPALQWPLPPPARTILVDTLPPSSPYSTNQPRDCIMLCAYILYPLPPCDYAAANFVAPHPARRAPRTSASTFRVSASMCGVVGERNTARTASHLPGIHGRSKYLIDEGVAANNGKSPVDKTRPWSIARSSARRTTGARIATS